MPFTVFYLQFSSKWDVFFFFTKTYIYDEFHLVGTDCDEMLLHFVTVVPKIGGREPGKAKEYQFLVLFFKVLFLLFSEDR